MDTSGVKEKVVEAAPKAARWIAHLARLGYISRGLLYSVLGILTFQAALGLRKSELDIQDALIEISRQPLGKPLLTITVIGLVGYMIWRFSLALLGENAASGKPDKVYSRAGHLLQGAASAAVVMTAWQFLTSPSPVKEENSQEMVFQVLTLPFGKSLLILIGIAVIGVGFSRFYRVYKGGFKKKLDERRTGKQIGLWTEGLNRASSLVHGFLYTTAGGLIIQAGIFQDPYRAGGIGKALRAIAFSPLGIWLLLAAALGLLAAGAASLIAGFFNRIQVG
jgi:hypothetical protein